MRRFFPVLLGLLVACEEEAVLHPPTPPALPTGELTGSAPRPAAAQAASAPSSAATTTEKPTADTIPKSKMTMETLMEDYLEPLAKKAFKSKQRSPELEDLLRQIGKMMPTDPKFAVTNPQNGWDAIVDNAIKAKPPKYGQSCKQCHTLWKKPYKKAFHKHEIDVVLPAAD